MHNVEEIIRGCQKYHKKAQKELYELFAPRIKGICLRYCKSSDDARDVMQDAFIKAFMNIEKYEWKGSFEGWLKKIVVRTAINHIKKNQQHNATASIDNETLTIGISENEIDAGYVYENEAFSFDLSCANVTETELLKLINALPEAFSAVFNLHCIEDYSHDEIATMLEISIGTSRSRLARARKMLQSELVRLTNSVKS